MREASGAFNRAAMNGNVIGKVECYLADGTYVEFGPQDIMQGGIAVTSGTSNSGSFGIGCAVIGRCTIRLRNDHRQLNGMALSQARVIPSVGAMVDGEIEWLKLGTYWVEPFEIYDDIVTLTCLDALSKFEKPCPTILAPVRLGTLVDQLCQACSVTGVSVFPNCNYIIQSVPDLSSKSCLDVLAYAAQVAGCYVIADWNGNVRLSWYTYTSYESWLDGGGFHFEVDDADGGGFHFEVDDADGGTSITPYAITELKSLSAGVAPHTVTGLAVSDAEGTQHVEGTDGYVLHIKDNPLIESGRAQDVAGMVAQHVLGKSLRQVRVSMPGSPVIEAGDTINVIDRFGESYKFWATSVSWGTSGTLSASCDVESSSPLVRTYRRSSAGGSSVDAAQVAGIVNNTLDHSLSDLTDIAAFGDINSAINGITGNIGEYTNPSSIAARLDGFDTSVDGLSGTVNGLSGTVGGLSDAVGNLSNAVGNYSSSSSIGDRLDALESGTSIGQWIIQVNGVAQTTGTINFVT
jgi:hypothetical protein